MSQTKKKTNFALVIIIYLAGIFMGAIDTGIVTPARTIIQSNLGVNEQTGIWMITIYTLAYAASIPIMGKLADKFGRKYIYLTSIFLFGVGSLFCGLSENFNNFNVLLVARVVQALGGGGILPVATAEFGTTFPEEKRGMALGLVGGVYGVANIFGASAGSAILDIFGANNWQFIFYINIPISIFILIAGFITLENTKTPDTSKIDFLGILTLTIMILSLLYSLKNLDFFNIKDTITNTDVLPFLIIFLVLIPFFILIERKAEDPVMNLNYFTNKDIVLTLLISLSSGIILMGMIFVPQFSENALRMSSGSGGYFVIILGVFAGIGAPISGKLIDKFGPKLILGFGFIISICGSLFLALIATANPSIITVVISLILIGMGVGFTMGTPLNYMMLSHTKESESNSALATLSLVRSIGTAIAPAIMVGFIAHAASNIQDEIMDDLPNKISLPKLPYSDEINTELNNLKENPQMKDKLSDINMPNLASLETVTIDFDGNSDYEISDNIVSLMRNSDITTVTNNCKIMSKTMFDQITPELTKNIQNGLQKGIDSVNEGISQMESNIEKMSQISSNPVSMKTSNTMSSSMTSVMSGSSSNMNTAVLSMEKNIDSMKSLSKKMTTLKNAVPNAFTKGEENYLREIDKRSSKIENTFQSVLNKGFKNIYLTTATASIIGLVLLSFYNNKRSDDFEE